MRRVGDVLAVSGYRLGWSAVRRLPERAAYGLFDRLADATTAHGGRGVQRLRANYARVRPELGPEELDHLVREGMRSYLRYYCEAFRLPDLSRSEIEQAVRVLGDGAVREELSAGRAGLVLPRPPRQLGPRRRLGNRLPGPVVTVVERLKPEEVYRVPRLPQGARDGDPAAHRRRRRVRRPRGHLTAGRIRLPLLAGRDLSARGLPVDLFGHRARMAAGPAALADRQPGPRCTRSPSTTSAPARPHLVFTLTWMTPSRTKRGDAMTQRCTDAS